MSMEISHKAYQEKRLSGEPLQPPDQHINILIAGGVPRVDDSGHA